MMSRFRLDFSLIAVLAFGLFPAKAATPPASTPFIPEIESFAPFPILVAAAAQRGIATEGFAPAASGENGFVAGDRVTALVSLRDGRKLTQWLIETAVVELDAEAKKQPPLPRWTFHTNVGTEILLGGTRAALAVRVLGPVEEGSRIDPGKVAERRASVTVNADFLSLGLQRACEAVLAVNVAKEADPSLGALNWGMRLRPYPENEVAAMRARAAALGLTPPRERALAGTVPVLQEFFRIVSRTPGLDDILKRVIDVPWGKVIARGGNVPVGMMPQYRYAERRGADPRFAAASETNPLYTVPVLVTIAGEHALVGNLALVDPQRPLLACAGIVGLGASAPNGKGPRLTLQAIATRRAD